MLKVFCSTFVVLLFSFNFAQAAVLTGIKAIDIKNSTNASILLNGAGSANTTQWTNGAFSNRALYPMIATFDLGQVYNVSQINLFHGQGGGGIGHILVSYLPKGGSSYQLIEDHTDGVYNDYAKVVQSGVVQTQYLQLEIDSYDAIYYVSELQVNGTLPSAVTTPTTSTVSQSASSTPGLISGITVQNIQNSSNAAVLVDRIAGNNQTQWISPNIWNEANYPMVARFDLGAVYDLSQINLFHGNGALGNGHVVVDYLPTNSKTGAYVTIENHGDQVWNDYSPVNLSKGIQARYLQFTIPSKDLMYTLSEVQVFGAKSVSTSPTVSSSSASISLSSSVAAAATPAPAASVPASTALACTLQAQGGTCDEIIDLGTNTYTKWDAVANKVQAGDLICLKAGAHPNAKLILQNITGTADQVVQIKNCGGVFSIGSENAGGIEIENSKFFLFSGTGSADAYGINLVGSADGQTAFNIGELSTDYEVEHVQIQKSGFAGIMAKTEPNCTDTNPTSFRGGFVQKNVSFHDNYIHDTQGEGFYIGYSFKDGLDINCSGQTVHVYSHPVVGLKVYNNLLERTGCEAIQFGLSTQADVHHNYINGYGRTPFAIYQNNGIQIGGNSGGKVHENFILNPDATYQVGSGIIMLGSDTTSIYNNTIVNAGDGMYIQYEASPGKTIDIVNNTIINPIGDTSSSHQGSGIWNGNSVATLRMMNNLVVMGAIVDTSLPATQITSGFGIYDQTQGRNLQRQGVYSSNITASNNLFLMPSDASNLFLNAANFDYRVKSTSALNQGTSIQSFAITTGMSIDSVSKTVQSTGRSVTTPDIGAFEVQ